MLNDTNGRRHTFNLSNSFSIRPNPNLIRKPILPSMSLYLQRSPKEDIILHAFSYDLGNDIEYLVCADNMVPKTGTINISEAQSVRQEEINKHL